MKKQIKKLNLNKVTVSNLEVKSIKGGAVKLFDTIVKLLDPPTMFGCQTGDNTNY